MKKLIALLMILAVVLTGVFADGGAAYTTNVHVLLKGLVGPEFLHGVVDNNMLFSSKTINGALDAAGVTFSYGYKTNNALDGKMYMAVQNFTNIDPNKSGTIQIKEIKIDGSTNFTITGDGILIFDGFTDNNILNSRTIFVKAAQDGNGADYLGGAINNHKANAPHGNYQATLTFKYVGN